MPLPSPPTPSRLDSLREEVRAIEVGGRTGAGGVLSFGVEAIDRRLAAGGLGRGALHDVAGASPGLADDAAATLFLAGIAARASAQGATVLWAYRWSDLFAPALAEVGLSAARLVEAECRRDEDVLAVMEEGLRHGGLAAVIGEVGSMPMAATRRLQLAAEESGTIALMLGKWRKSSRDPLTQPSAAVTRWRIGCSPSVALPVPGVGRACWHIDLVRQRGGEMFQWIMEGCDAEGRLALPARPGDRSAAADRGPVRHAA